MSAAAPSAPMTPANKDSAAPSSGHAQVVVDAIEHSYGENTVLRKLSFSLQRGEIGCLLGNSGCGKTTVLRCIAGFEPLAAGRISLNNVLVSAARFSMPTEERHIGVVFQEYALFPHLDIRDNIAFGLHRVGKQQRRLRVNELLEIVGLAHSGTKFPHELSGGQQQRVALARALAPQPDLLLLDEPFSNLDVGLRERLSIEVRDILKQQNATAILVTHDQHEAFNIADVIGIMSRGAIEQWDTPYNLYHQPASRFVADFIGQGTFLRGVAIDQNRVQIELGTFASNAVEPFPVGSPVEVLMRPDDILHDDASPLRAEVLHKAFRGSQFLYTMRLPGGGRVMSLVPSHHNHAIGEKVGIRLDIEHVVAFRS